MPKLLIAVVMLSSGGFALAADPVIDVFEDQGDLFIRAGRSRGVEVGTEIQLLGNKIADTEERRVVGKANVMEVWDSIARIKPDEAGKKAQAKFAKLAAGREAPRAAEPVKPAAAPATSGRAGADSSSGFSDRLIGECDGVRVEVTAQASLTGGTVFLRIDDKLADSGQVSVGGRLLLKGTVKGKPATLLVTQGMFGTDYVLKTDGRDCTLRDQG